MPPLRNHLKQHALETSVYCINNFLHRASDGIQDQQEEHEPSKVPDDRHLVIHCGESDAHSILLQACQY
jgi:hypothetical protein